MYRKKKGRNIERGLLPSFNKSIFNSSFDIGADIIESTIDSIVDNPVFEAIPFVKAGKACIKSVIAIHDRFLLKKTACFLKAFNDKNISHETLEKFKSKFKSEKELNAELERILILIDKEIEIEKIDILVNLFSALINEKIDLERFRDYTELLGNIYICDLKVLQNNLNNIDNEGILKVSREYYRYFKRLSSQGIGVAIIPKIISGGNAEGNNDFHFEYYGFDEYSVTFIECGLGYTD